MRYTALIILAILVVLDFIACLRILRSSLDKDKKKYIIAAIVVSNIFIYLTPLFIYLFKDGDNNSEVTKIIMSVITLFILFSLAKITVYVYWIPSSNKKFLYAGFISAVAVSLFYLYGVLVTRTDYQVKEVDLKFKDLPEGFDGYKVVFISDIHLGTMYNQQKELSQLSAIIERIDADVLMFGGDLVNVNYEEITPLTLEFLSKIRCKEPTLAVLGNHDTGTYMFDTTGCPMNVNIENIKKRLDTVEWRLLMDSTVYLYKGKDFIAVTGIDYNKELLKYKHSFDDISDYNFERIYSSVDKDIFNITISHLPQLWNVLSNKGYSDLTLSGHIHAMQFKVNLFGYEFSPAMFIYKEWSGVYENRKGKLYINDGIGNVGFFARIGARPEITVITLYKG